MRIFLLGFMGSGKSYWGRKLSASLELPLFDLDDEIVKQEGKSIAVIFEQQGETAFRRLEDRYLRTLAQQDNFLISCGGGTPCYSDNMSFMNKNGLTVWLDVPVDVMVNRLKRNKNKRPLLKELVDNELEQFIKNKLEERTGFYKQAQLIVNPIKYDLQSLTQKIKSCTNRI